MQLTNKKAKLATLALITLASSFGVRAASQELVGSFSTIKDASITEVDPLAPLTFVGLLMTQTNGTCTMLVPGSGAGYPGDTLMRLANVGVANAPNSPGAIPAVNGACVGGDGTIGLYEVDGSPGTSVIITVSGQLTGSVEYTPLGCAGDYNTGANGDVCEPLVISGTDDEIGTITVRLADATDTTNSAGEGVPAVGKTRLALGGVVTALVGLSAATEYPVNFDISVTY
jgi:hypothetical protein